jgi:16S rRNA (guanine(966)-N(2))-methyltransferase RsmD
MRVISGNLKGRIIKGYNIEGTRPTMDRVKESIFGTIQNYIKDSVVLDLFAGSGNLGIEAISNGSKYCYFIDNNKEAIKILNDNIRNFNIDNKCSVSLNDYDKSLTNFKDNGIKFDIIFVDPPYKYMIIEELIDKIYNYELLNYNGLLVLEFQSDRIKDDYMGLTLLKKKKYNDKYVYIFKKTLDK